MATLIVARIFIIIFVRRYVSNPRVSKLSFTLHRTYYYYHHSKSTSSPTCKSLKKGSYQRRYYFITKKIINHPSIAIVKVQEVQSCKSFKKMAHIVDMRSDTVTKPSEAMKHAMVNSALGDDVFREDPTVNALEQKLAAMLGKQAALFVPSGTMANLIAIMVHCDKRGSEVLAGSKSHVFRSEQGGASHIAGALLTTLSNNPDGTFNLDDFEKHIRGSRIHEPITSLVAVENTHNACGGKVLPLCWLDDLSARAKKHSIPVHMDGARLFNACAHLEVAASRVVRGCDSVSVCFSKGLAAPVGSALVGSERFIEQVQSPIQEESVREMASVLAEDVNRMIYGITFSVSSIANERDNVTFRARRVRKMLGGGMRQAGVVAAAAIVALDEGLPKLASDHRRAQDLAIALRSLGLKKFFIDEENQTNIVILTLSPCCSIEAKTVVDRLAQVSQKETQGDCKTEKGEGVIVKAIYFDNKTIRFTLHCDIDDQDLYLAIMKITYVLKEFEDSYT